MREMIDNALFDGDLVRVKQLSQRITSAMKGLSEIAEGAEGWRVIFSGGDDICLTVELFAYREIIIQSLMRRFNELTGGTISFGVGASIESAYINLRRAKSRGRGILVATDVG